MLENEIYEWLNTYQIATPKYKVCGLNEKLEVDFFPVALKFLSDKVVHKTEMGAVVIHINNEQELEIAKSKILSNLCQHNIHVDVESDKLIVTKMCSGIEFFFGIVNDGCFGKVIAFGTGGIFAELFKDICFIDSEADVDEIKNAIVQTKIGTLFTNGFRGRKYNIQLVVDMVKKLQQLDVDEMDLNPVLSNDTLTVVDARIKRGVPGNISKQIKYIPEIFSPKKVAIIGVSQHREKIGFALAKNTSDYNDAYFVNPHLQSLCGKNVYNDITSLPDVDTAVIAIPSRDINEAIQQLVLKKVKQVVIITAGFKEAGRDEKFLKEISEKFQINIIGPNCIGIYSNGINLTFGTNDIHPGKTNLFSQSGAIVAELMDKAALQNTGFENIISVGNMVDVDFADLINSYSGNNPINLYIEGISNGKNLLRAIRKSNSIVSIFKAGRTEASKKAAFSHTGNMAGNYEIFVSLLKAAGAKMLNNVNGLLYPYSFHKILIITNAGGAGTIMSDLISDKLYKLSPDEIAKISEVLPSHWSKNNPVDIIGDASYERYLQVLQVVDNFATDAIFVVLTPQFMTEPEIVCKLFVENIFKTKIFPVLLGGELMQSAKHFLEEQRIGYFEELTEAVSFL
jgi:acyl-CoA synthetase (NDP forming)